MSEWNKGESGPIPSRWLNCPRKSVKLIHNKFLAFKTPLSSNFNNQVPEECRFTVEMLLASIKSQRLKLGLWIDLTNTSRFYNKYEIEKNGVRYLKLQCRGYGETPSMDQTKTFVQVCKKFIAHNPLEIIGVHCTHGYNRTGFLIVSYLVETDEGSLDASLAQFIDARPPGIYKGDYIRELYSRYDDIEDAPAPPSPPAWYLEYDDSNVEGEDEGTSMGSESPKIVRKKRKREHFNQNPVFMAGVPGVTPILDFQKAFGIQRRVQDICGWQTNGFPGSQPVSMDLENLCLLHEKPYRVSWKADGTRYMMLVQGDGQVFFIDRNNSIFLVDKLSFPHVRDCNRKLKDTLLDGEMVIDKAQGKEYPRYLAYDVIMYDGKDVSKLAFYPERYSIIEKEIMAGRHRAMKEGRLIREKEPFSVRLKEFWDVTQTGSLLSDKFAKQLGHEPDGLIFQPDKEPYKAGPCLDVLKWKPQSLNSVDFKLKVVVESGVGIVRRSIGELYVGGLEVPFDKIKLTKQLKELNNKIIECKFENNQWVFMRKRNDKSFPNSFTTVKAVCASISNPITKEKLLDFIRKHRFSPDDAELMPPPRNLNNLLKVHFFPFLDRTVLIWCTKDLSSKDRRSLRVNVEYDFASLVRWSPDGKAFIIHKSLANIIEVYKVSKKSDGTLASATKAIEFPKQHKEDVIGLDIACNGRYIITCSKKNDLAIWDLKGQILNTIDTYLGSTHKARISPCGRFVGASGFTPDVKIWEIAFTKSGEFKQVVKGFDLAGHSSGVYDFAFNSDTSRMATVSKDGTYRFYDTKVEFEKGEDPHLISTGQWEISTPATIALSPNAEIIVIAHGSSLSFYSTVNGELDTTIVDIFNGPIKCLMFDSLGEFILIAGDRHIKIFRNIPGYRASIETARKKLSQRQTSATKERLEKTIIDCEKFLKDMGEHCS